MSNELKRLTQCAETIVRASNLKGNVISAEDQMIADLNSGDPEKARKAAERALSPEFLGQIDDAMQASLDEDVTIRNFKKESGQNVTLPRSASE